MTTWPWLPIELIERIIFEVWMLPLSAYDRTTFMASSSVVNKTWRALFMKISSRDAHIPNVPESEQFFRILRNEHPLYPRDDPLTSPEICCRSLTFTIDSNPSPIDHICGEPLQLFGERNLHKMGLALSNTLSILQEISYLPNLRRISIIYVDCGFEDIFGNMRLSSFPLQVTHLEIRFTYTKRTTERMLTRMHQRYRKGQQARWCSGSIRHLSVSGASAGFVADISGTCPKLELLDMDSSVRLSMLPPLSQTLHTITLQRPTSQLHLESYITLLGYDLIGRLLRPRTAQQDAKKLVLEWGPIPEPSWRWLKHIADEAGVELIQI